MTRSRTFEQYAADGVLVLGGAAAILLQVADPVVAHGVAGYSSFARDPMRRLRSTLSYVYAVGLGTDAQAALAAGSVDRAHHGIPGAMDAQRQLWVAATLHELGREVHELVHGPLAPQLADEIYAASGRLGTMLQLPPEAWPADRAAFAAYWADAVAGLEVTDEARGIARELLHSRAAPWWIRAGLPLARVVTAGLLPPTVRDAYGLAHHPARYRTAIRFVRVLVRVTPRRLRELPSRRLLARLDEPHRGSYS
ncbi:oxygenase MpaB family protein [Lysinimonas soli]|uniref:Oxygenase MpaB family protein n=1 Tax=Lysinimonas soli TaxID=1074233 RepID=A0ABW0NQN4_9MICO